MSFSPEQPKIKLAPAVSCSTNAIGDRIHEQTLVDMVLSESAFFPNNLGIRGARIVGQSDSEHACCKILRDVVDRNLSTDCRISAWGAAFQTLGGGCSCRDKLPISPITCTSEVQWVFEYLFQQDKHGKVQSCPTTATTARSPAAPHSATARRTTPRSRAFPQKSPPCSRRCPPRSSTRSSKSATTSPEASDAGIRLEFLTSASDAGN